ncbi:IclR family transcriptional regulator [Bacillus sp. DTU_2020_1000418_1_SI_GHA_SEK_038]|uniref:IclR family transcriptional regulator n=1 Tax=Bacillus sp. DTU_2020_1000418_1_SI_GHA_SEK_038 TaxID=3077585 RepID=UPI0028E38953|nr:IclR family transcriptional regulator [Bacillus sp. DTU_2020_1000418_1_SI_GHA_SEK_038]WNS76247.1 IclR family transcriptional regulator [Bacillus sp. DTU_2020_1000418_1_SI_GHA_SEK_038]
MEKRESPVSSVEKALNILECFDSKNTWLTLNEISMKTGYSKTATFRMIKSFETYGYVKRDSTLKEAKFSLGWAFLHKANLITEQMNIRDLAKDDLIDLRNKTELTVQLAIRDGYEAVYIEQFESLNPIKIYSQVGKKAPLYAAAGPRVLLAYSNEQEQNQILANSELFAYTKNTLTDINQIKAELLKIREDGYAVSRGELYEGTMEIACPVFDLNGIVAGEISIVGLESDFKEDQLEKCINDVKLCARNISLKLEKQNYE